MIKRDCGSHGSAALPGQPAEKTKQDPLFISQGFKKKKIWSIPGLCLLLILYSEITPDSA